MATAIVAENSLDRIKKDKAAARAWLKTKSLVQNQIDEEAEEPENYSFWGDLRQWWHREDPVKRFAGTIETIQKPVVERLKQSDLRGLFVDERS